MCRLDNAIPLCSCVWGVPALLQLGVSTCRILLIARFSLILLLTCNAFCSIASSSACVRAVFKICVLQDSAFSFGSMPAFVIASFCFLLHDRLLSTKSCGVPTVLSSMLAVL